MTLDDLTKLALEEYDGMAFVMDESNPVFVAIVNDMRDAVVAVLAAVKRECVPEPLMNMNDWNDCIDEMNERLDRLMQSPPST